MTPARARFEPALRVLVVAALVAGPPCAAGFSSPLPDGAAESASAAAPEILFFQDVAWSPDGASIAFSGYAGSGDEYQAEKWTVFVASADGASPRILAANARWVSWSPDGTKLAFSSPREGNWDLYAVDRDGSNPQRLTSDEADDSAPSWSPSGREIAFTSTRDGNSEVYVLAVDGSGERRLTDDPAADHNPAWSPDGSGLVFYREAGGGSADQIYWISADGEQERPLTRDAHLNTFPAYLPDGRVTFSRKFHDSAEERLVVLEAADARETLIGPAGAFFGRWSPDGREVLYVAGEWPQASLFRMNADGSEARKVF